MSALDLIKLISKPAKEVAKSLPSKSADLFSEILKDLNIDLKKPKKIALKEEIETQSDLKVPASNEATQKAEIGLRSRSVISKVRVDSYIEEKRAIAEIAQTGKSGDLKELIKVANKHNLNITKFTVVAQKEGGKASVIFRYIDRSNPKHSEPKVATESTQEPKEQITKEPIKESVATNKEPKVNGKVALEDMLKAGAKAEKKVAVAVATKVTKEDLESDLEVDSQEKPKEKPDVMAKTKTEEPTIKTLLQTKKPLEQKSDRSDKKIEVAPKESKEPKVAEPKLSEAKVVEPKAVEPKVVEPKLSEPKVVEPKTTQPTPSKVEPKLESLIQTSKTNSVESKVAGDKKPKEPQIADKPQKITEQKSVVNQSDLKAPTKEPKQERVAQPKEPQTNQEAKKVVPNSVQESKSNEPKGVVNRSDLKEPQKIAEPKEVQKQERANEPKVAPKQERVVEAKESPKIDNKPKQKSLDLIDKEPKVKSQKEATSKEPEKSEQPKSVEPKIENQKTAEPKIVEPKSVEPELKTRPITKEPTIQKEAQPTKLEESMPKEQSQKPKESESNRGIQPKKSVKPEQIKVAESVPVADTKRLDLATLLKGIEEPKEPRVDRLFVSDFQSVANMELRSQISVSRNTLQSLLNSVPVEPSEESEKEQVVERKSDIRQFVTPQKEEIEYKIRSSRATLNHFSNSLREAISNYKPPVTKIAITLNPASLGSVDVVLRSRGKNLEVTLSSNPQAVTMLYQNSGEFRQNLLQLGYDDVNLSFSDGKGSGGKGQNPYSHTNGGKASESEDESDGVLAVYDEARIELYG